MSWCLTYEGPVAIADLDSVAVCRKGVRMESGPVIKREITDDRVVLFIEPGEVTREAAELSGFGIAAA